LLEQGGKRLDKAEVQALLVGATLAGPTTTGGDVRLEVKADGSLSGNIRAVRSFGVMGTWKLEEDGRFVPTFPVEVPGRSSLQPAITTIARATSTSWRMPSPHPRPRSVGAR
jgi:hypothetical protein